MIVNKHSWHCAACLSRIYTMPNKPIAREISLSKKATLSPSELIQMFFTSHNVCKRYFCFLKAKQTCIYFTFQCSSFKEYGLQILIMTNKFSWQNWLWRKSLDNQEIRIIEIQIIEVQLYCMNCIFYNSLIPENNLHLISLHNIAPELHIKLTRIKEMITNERSSRLGNKFYLSGP